MKILVMSDLHGKILVADKILSDTDAEVVLFTGDGIREMQRLSEKYKNLKFHMVAGNCDFLTKAPSDLVIELETKRIWLTHGHNYYVKSTLANLKKKAKEIKADIAVFGHTHVPYSEYSEGIWLVNGGSLGNPRTGIPTYATINIANNGVVVNIAYI